MIKELIVNGVRLKRLPGSDYYIGPDGLLFILRQCVPDKHKRYRITKKGKRIYRTVDSLSHTYDKL